ncbi:MAG: hypothetical protein ACREDT_11585 [Methylocella sp.]
MAMRIELKILTGIASLMAGHFDLHEEFGAACLVEAGERVTLYLNQVECRSWLKQEHPNIEKIKWLDFNQVVLYHDGIGAAIVSAESWNNIRLGGIDKLLISKNYIFVSYNEDAFFLSWPNALENNIISVFSCDGRLQFGLHDLCDKDRDADKLIEIGAAYTFLDHIVFIGYYSEFVWNLDVPHRTWKKVPFPFEEAGLRVLTGDAKRAYAIFDHRSLLSHDPDLPPFELAVFDLSSETSAKQDFAPVEAALTAAGFAMNEIKFQPNSTGRIIVSDGKQAALLEFSEPYADNGK